MRFRIVVSLLVCSSLGACKKEGGSTGATAAAPAATEVVIGATLPLTGSEARIGAFYKEGYDLAFEELKNAGGLDVGGKKLPARLILLDDTSAQATAASLAERLIHQDKANFLIGTYSSHLVEAQSVVAEQNAVPYVNGGAGATHIYKRGFKWLFGLLAPVESLSIALMEWVDSQQKAGKLPKPGLIAVLWENTSHGKDFRAGVQSFVKDHGDGYKVAVDESFELNGRDFGALLNKVKASGAQLFLADAHLPDYITMQRQYVTAGLCHPVQSYGARGSEKQAVDALGKENVAYILSAVWWSNQLERSQPSVKKFNELFKAKYNRLPEWYQALGYETARAMFAGIQKAGSLDRTKVRDALASLEMDSILPGGKLTFPAKTGQQAQNPFTVQQNQPDGTSPIVWPKDVASNPGSVKSCRK
jgi:branched-chain amino acid transport system substrate-binding protein